MGIYHESNTFIDQYTTMSNFQEGHIYFGKKIISVYKDAFHEIGGIIEVFDLNSIQLIPIMYAEATPGGVIDKKTSEELLAKLIDELSAALPLDGLMVVPHGAAVSVINDDFDGHWLDIIRKHLGQLPIIGTLDPHANVSQKMIDNVDAFVAYKTNPHIDQREVGKKAAQLMRDTLAGKIKPYQKLCPSRIAISIDQQYTAAEPCKSFYHLVEKLSQTSGVLSISVLLGFPYADVYDMGTASLVVTDNDPEIADNVLQKIEFYLQENHQLFLGKKISIKEALVKIDISPKPVLLLDMGDNVGGGSPGDGTFLLDALEKINKFRSFICIYDPEAAKILSECPSNKVLKIAVGAKTDSKHGKTINVKVTIVKIVDGKFKEKEPRHGGQVYFDMGTTAIVETLKGTTIMLTSKRIVPFSLMQLLHFKVNPAEFDVIVAKGVQAPIAAYGPSCPTIVRVNTSGSTAADMVQFTYKNRKQPLFPFEKLNYE